MNLDKLDAAIAHIEANPGSWDQESWFRRGDGGCGTSACLAGTVALLDGWTPSEWEPHEEWDEDIGGWVQDGEETGTATKDGETEEVQVVAARILGLGAPYEESFTPRAMHPLFVLNNTLDDIKRQRDEYAATTSGEAGERSDTPNPSDLGGSS